MSAPRWVIRTRLAAAFCLANSDVPTVALAGFLIRGGLALLLLPSVVLPSVIAIAGATGVRAFTLSGDPTPWFVGVLAVAGIGALAWLVLSLAIGSLTDRWLVREAVELGYDGADRFQPAAGPGLIAGMASVRLACLVPLAAALAWAGGRVYTATYNELTLPSDVAAALPIRVLGDATDAVAIVAATWLACETVAAIAVRRMILTGASPWRAIGSAIVQIVRRPLWTLLAVAISFAATGVALALAFLGTATAYGWVAATARSDQPIVVKLGFGALTTTRDFRPLAFLLAVVALAAAWLVALALAGLTSAWRSGAITHEVMAALGNRTIDTEVAGVTETG